MPSMCNSFPLFISYKEYIFPNWAAKPSRYSPVKPDIPAPEHTDLDRKREEINRRISRLTIREAGSQSESQSHVMARSPDLSTRHDPGSPVTTKEGTRDKDYFDTMVLSELGGDRDVIANVHAIQRTDV